MRKKNLFASILDIDDVFGMISLVVIVTVTILSVFMRYVIGDPIKWTEEVVLALFVWFTFLGASSATKWDKHIGIDFITDLMPAKIQTVLKYFRYLLLIAVSGVVFIYLGWNLAIRAYHKLTPVLGIKYTYIDLALPLAGILIIIHTLRQVWESLTQKNNIIQREE